MFDICSLLPSKRLKSLSVQKYNKSLEKTNKKGQMSS